jgi:hypothetical protein
MTGDLVTVASHAADQARPWGCGIIDGALAKITTCDVECCLDIVALRLLDDTRENGRDA